ncbi:uncharacterized protein B0I36DRAFT_116078 [Microdochium trichocladiopsis]|uniref:Uncharacterized protein n=1 Tax=Microdochium trichocladiopsis TaxID=1682393 RepID=A0A9P8Y730_9PEZI|nr:uncharacterized protein B0I36DRAFT_116078 [Microdochium trichocladiopsis]KAH7030923.1 hypothetical protein B0I36DRAFT_116078 [Microdochium trichocladiopsis]
MAALHMPALPKVVCAAGPCCASRCSLRCSSCVRDKSGQKRMQSKFSVNAAAAAQDPPSWLGTRAPPAASLLQFHHAGTGGVRRLLMPVQTPSTHPHDDIARHLATLFRHSRRSKLEASRRPLAHSTQASSAQARPASPLIEWLSLSLAPAAKEPESIPGPGPRRLDLLPRWPERVEPRLIASIIYGHASFNLCYFRHVSSGLSLQTPLWPALASAPD